MTRKKFPRPVWILNQSRDTHRLKEAEEKRKAQEKVEAEQRRVVEEEQRRRDEEQKRKEEEERASHVETIPQYTTVRRLYRAPMKTPAATTREQHFDD